MLTLILILILTGSSCKPGFDLKKKKGFLLMLQFCRIVAQIINELCHVQVGHNVVYLNQIIFKFSISRVEEDQVHFVLFLSIAHSCHTLNHILS